MANNELPSSDEVNSLTSRYHEITEAVVNSYGRALTSLPGDGYNPETFVTAETGDPRLDATPILFLSRGVFQLSIPAGSAASRQGTLTAARSEIHRGHMSDQMVTIDVPAPTTGDRPSRVDASRLVFTNGQGDDTDKMLGYLDKCLAAIDRAEATKEINALDADAIVNRILNHRVDIESPQRSASAT